MFRLRWITIAVAFVFGMHTWAWWQPKPHDLLWALTGLSVVFLMTYRISLHRILILLMAFLVGNVRLSSMTNVSKSLPENTHSILWVEHISGRQALVENNRERWLIQFNSIPPQGSLIAVWHKPLNPSVVWKGGRSKERIATLSRAPQRYAIDWVLLKEVPRLNRPENIEFIQNGGFLWALVSGDKSGVSRSIKTLMNRTGTSHLLAISGMHIGILATVVYAFVKGVLGWSAFIERGVWSHRIGIVLSIMVSIWYGEQVGWSSSSQRAVCMITILGIAKMLELECSPWDVLGVTAIFILIKEPSLLYDLGFQLSFSAVAGIALVLSKVHFRSSSVLLTSVVISSLVTVGATLGTLPIVGWVFQSVPLMGVIANILVTPLIGVISVPMVMFGVVSSQWGFDGVSLLSLMIADASIELALMLLKPLDLWVMPIAFNDDQVGFVTVLILLVFLSKSYFLKTTGCVGVLLILLCSTPLERCWRTWLLRVDTLTIRFLDVGQGDASLLEWGEGNIWLIDGGPFSFELVPFLRREGVWHIDRVWLSHPHQDHLGGLLNVMSDLSVGSLMVGRYPKVSEKDFFKLVGRAHQRGVKVQVVGKEKKMFGEPELNEQVKVLHPNLWTVQTADKCNEESVVIQVCESGICVLFTGDIEEDAEKRVHSSLTPVDIVKVAHHGSNSSTSEAFYTKIQPKHAIISVGRQNYFRHPHPSVMWTLRSSNIWRTDIDGTVRAYISSDGLTISGE